MSWGNTDVSDLVLSFLSSIFQGTWRLYTRAEEEKLSSPPQNCIDDLAKQWPEFQSIIKGAIMMILSCRK